jgi:general secretion pathway protein N
MMPIRNLFSRGTKASPRGKRGGSSAPDDRRPRDAAGVVLRDPRWEHFWRTLAWFGVAALICAVTALIMFPAAWVAPQFARATQGRVILADPQGSLWHGSARLMLSAGARDGAAGGDFGGATLMPYRIEWHTQPGSLLTGRVQMTLREMRPLSEPIVLNASRNEARLSAGGIAVPASLLVGLGAPFNTLALEGDVRLEWTEWHVIGNRAYGQLTVRLKDMGSSVSRLRPVGSYRATVMLSGQDATLDIETLNGPLSVTGKGQWQGGHFRFAGKAGSTPEAHANLAGLLNLLGPRIDDNTNSLTINE